MKADTKITHSDAETKELGKQIATTLTGGDVVCLYGELGAGKTTLVKGLAEALGITETITSPTFTLMNVYRIIKTLKHKNIKTIKNLVHIDTYRLKSADELVEIGVEDYLGQPNTITIVEWPEKITELLDGKQILEIKIEHGKGDERKIEIKKL